MLDTVIAGGILLSGHDRYRPRYGSIGIENGRIAYAGERELKKTDGRSFVDASGCVVMPGLINGHCHGDMAFAKGAAENTTLYEQMSLFYGNNWFYNDITDEERYYSRLHTYCEALLSGTTLLMENMYWSLGELSQTAFTETGLRGAPAEDIRYDFYHSDSFLTEDMLSGFSKRCRESGLIPVLGTLPEEEFTAERLKRVSELTKKSGCYFTSHLAETGWRHEAAVKNMGASPVKALDRFGLINERYIGSHAVYLDDGDIALMAKNGAKVVNTPVAEMKISDGIAPIPALIKAGVTVALGTDGAIWNNSGDLFREMKCMGLLHSLNSGPDTFAARDILDMATINGAKLFGRERELGTLEEDKLADIILVDVTAPHNTPIHVGKRENVASTIVYCATGQDVRDVFVGGRHVVANKTLPHVNLLKIQEQVQKTADRLFNE